MATSLQSERRGDAPMLHSRPQMGSTLPYHFKAAQFSCHLPLRVPLTGSGKDSFLGQPFAQRIVPVTKRV